MNSMGGESKYWTNFSALFCIHGNSFGCNIDNDIRYIQLSVSLSQSTEQATGSQAMASRLSGNFSSFSSPFSLHLLRMIPLDWVIQRAAAAVAACVSHWNVCTHELLLHATWTSSVIYESSRYSLALRFIYRRHLMNFIMSWKLVDDFEYTLPSHHIGNTIIHAQSTNKTVWHVPIQTASDILFITILSLLCVSVSIRRSKERRQAHSEYAVEIYSFAPEPNTLHDCWKQSVGIQYEIIRQTELCVPFHV